MTFIGVGIETALTIFGILGAYIFFGVCFGIAYDKFNPTNNCLGWVVWFWPIVLLYMVTCCLFGCINRLYRWLDI